MKLKSLPQIFKITALPICIGLLIVQPLSATITPYKALADFKVVSGKDAFYKKEKHKPLSLRNNNSVKIYLDASQKKVHVIAKENNGKQIDFFLFDLEGTLIHNHKLKVKDHHRVTNLVKGVYVYRVFCGDEETASGQLEIQ